MPRGPHSLVLGLAIALLAPGCVLGPVDLESKPCPCANGYVCDETRNRCVRDGTDAGQVLPLDATTEDATVELDAPVDDPSTACDDLLRDAIFCESFEDISLLHWTVRESYDGTVAHTFERAFRGAGALTASSTAPAGYAERIATVVGGISDGDIHVRAYVYIPAGMPLVHSSLVHIGGHRTRVATEPLAGFNAVDGFAAMYIGAGSVSLRDRLVTLPRDEWFCMQYQLHVDDVAGSARIWIDGVLAGEALDIDTHNESPYESLGAGIAWSALDQEPFEVAVDEIAIGRSPLPCE